MTDCWMRHEWSVRCTRSFQLASIFPAISFIPFSTVSPIPSVISMPFCLGIELARFEKCSFISNAPKWRLVGCIKTVNLFLYSFPTKIQSTFTRHWCSRRSASVRSLVVLMVDFLCYQPYHFTFHDEQVISNGEDARKVIKFFVSADFVSSSVLNNGASGAWDVGVCDR